MHYGPVVPNQPCQDALASPLYQQATFMAPTPTQPPPTSCCVCPVCAWRAATVKHGPQPGRLHLPHSPKAPCYRPHHLLPVARAQGVHGVLPPQAGDACAQLRLQRLAQRPASLDNHATAVARAGGGLRATESQQCEKIYLVVTDKALQPDHPCARRRARRGRAGDQGARWRMFTGGVRDVACV